MALVHRGRIILVVIFKKLPKLTMSKKIQL